MNNTRLLRPQGFIGVILAVIMIFLVIPLFASSVYVHLALQNSFTLLLLSTLYAINTESVAQKNWNLKIGVLLAIPFIFFDTLSVFHHSILLMIVAYSFYCVFVLFTISVLSRRVFISENIDTNLLFGAITIYLLAGILFAKLYFLVDFIYPNSFHGVKSLNVDHDGINIGYQNQFELLYYSFSILSTLGMGDISPISRPAQSLTMLEAMFGQLFVATAIAKTVSVWRKSERKEK